MTPSPQDPVSQSPSPPQSENIDYGVSGLCGLPPGERAKWWLTALAFWLPDEYSGPVQDIKATELLSIEERIVLVEAVLEFILTMQNKSHALRKTGRGAIKSPNRERWANANKPLEFQYSVVIQLLQDAINAPREYSETDTHEAAYIRMRELKLEVEDIEKEITAARKNNIRLNFSPHRYYDPHEKKRRTNWAFGGWDETKSTSDWISKSNLNLSSNKSKSHLNLTSTSSKSPLISNSSNAEAPSNSVSRERAPMPKRKGERRGNLLQLEQQPMVKVKIEEEGMISLADDADTNVDASPSPSQSRIEPQYTAQAPVFSFHPPRSNPVAGPSKPRLTIPTRSSSNSVKLEPEAESASASAATPPPWSPTESSPSSSSFSSPNSCRPQAIPPWMPVNPDYAYRPVHPQPHPQHVHAYRPPRPYPHPPPPPHAPQPHPSHHPHRQIPRPSHGDAESTRRQSEWSSSSAQLPPIQYVYAQAALGAMERGGELGSGSA
ncbi:hypothetical protein R3P38DRAFT_2902614 [Favolaschia claudopus]|uniref:WHIM1 domain-containing protein n=1 Tax=Favolaschia claudopus TaxID=2862362 RepID=A0AAW0CK68_9AGAR